jgi:hypothetical protein
MKYILAGATPGFSKLNQCPMWRITWYCVDDNTIWEMTVDESYRNWDHWRPFVANPSWGVYSGLRRTKRVTREGVRVVSADTRPQLIEPFQDQAEAHDVIIQCDQIHLSQTI